MYFIILFFSDKKINVEQKIQGAKYKPLKLMLSESNDVLVHHWSLLALICPVHRQL